MIKDIIIDSLNENNLSLKIALENAKENETKEPLTPSISNFDGNDQPHVDLTRDDIDDGVEQASVVQHQIQSDNMLLKQNFANSNTNVIQQENHSNADVTIPLATLYKLLQDVEELKNPKQISGIINLTTEIRTSKYFVIV